MSLVQRSCTRRPAGLCTERIIAMLDYSISYFIKYFTGQLTYSTISRPSALVYSIGQRISLTA